MTPADRDQLPFHKRGESICLNFEDAQVGTMADTAGRECLQAGICISHAGRTAAMISCSRERHSRARSASPSARTCLKSHTLGRIIAGLLVLCWCTKLVVSSQNAMSPSICLRQNKANLPSYSAILNITWSIAIVPLRPPHAFTGPIARACSRLKHLHTLLRSLPSPSSREKKEPDDSLSNSAVPPFH